MAWSAPRTWTTGEIVAASFFNIDVRDDIYDLDRRVSPVAGYITTSENTTSPTYTNLATAGPAATVVIGTTGQAMVTIYAHLENDVADQTASMNYEVSGQTSFPPTQVTELVMYAAYANQKMRFGATFLHSGLNAGSNTFTAKYKVTAGTGIFRDRWITVTPLGS